MIFAVAILLVPQPSLIAQTGLSSHPGWRELVRQGDQLYVEQRHAEAGAKYREALKSPEAAASEEVRAVIHCALGLVETDVGHYSEAELMLKGCPASTPAQRLAGWTNLATLYSDTDRFGEADRLFRQAYDLVQQDGSGITPMQRALLFSNMASHALRKGDYQAAEPLLRDARDLYAKTGSTWDSVDSTGNLAIALIKEGRLDEARPELERAIRETEAVGGPSHPMLAGLLGCLAVVDDREGRFADAELRLRRALAVAGADYHYLPELLSTYAWTLRSLHRGGEAKAVEKRARAFASTRRPQEVVSLSELLRESGKSQ